MKLFGYEFEGFAKALVILAAIFLVASGMCGLQLLVANLSPRGGGDLLFPLGILELAAMLLSAAAIVLVLIAWVGRALYAQISGTSEREAHKLFESPADSTPMKVSQPQKLFDDEDDTKLNKKE